MSKLNCLWNYLKNKINCLFRTYFFNFGEMELLCGEYEISLPLNCCRMNGKVKEFWINIHECGHPVCHGDESFNWVSYRIFKDEIVIKAKIQTQKATMQWFIVS